eukprot:m.45275 g.45275  ORF g.45275 m.45275 type:complete len:466 (+) comp10660_c0_seq1:44-1441(+)
MTSALPKLIAQVRDHHHGSCADTIYLPQKKAIITGSLDKQILICLRRDTGQYWPSVSVDAPAAVTCLHHNPSTSSLFVGLASGTIQEYDLSEDMNSLTATKSFPAHQGRVNEILFDPERNFLLSCAADNSVTLSSTVNNGKRLSSLSLTASCLQMQYDESSQTVFVGDFHGDINVLGIKENKFFKKTDPLQGHQGSIQSLLWVPQKRWLFSGSFDKRVILWDIGGKNGDTYELHAHTMKVRSLTYIDRLDILISIGDDLIITWDFSKEREVSPEWNDGDKCEICEKLFFWSVKEMWARKTFSVKRQHHCRRCGKAVCDECSSFRSTYPIMGFENSVRICDACKKDVQDSNLTPLAKRFPFTGRFERVRYHLDTDTILVSLKSGDVKLLSMRPVLDHSKQGSSSLSPTTTTSTTTATTASTVEENDRSKQTLTAIVDMTTKSASDDEDDDDDIFAAIDNAEDDLKF